MNLREALVVAVTATAGCADNTVIDKINTGLRGGDSIAHEQKLTMAEEIAAIRRKCTAEGNRVVNIMGETSGIDSLVKRRAEDARIGCLRKHGLSE